MNFVSNNVLSMLGGDDLSSINQAIIDLDASVVHKTGYQTETINGLKTFTSNLTINNADTRITAAGTGSGTDGLIILKALDPMLTTVEGKIKAFADTQIQLKVNTSSAQVVLGDLGVGIDGGYNYTNSLYLENHNIGEVSSLTSGVFNISDAVTTKLMFSVNDSYVKLQAPNSGGGIMEISSDLMKFDAVTSGTGQLYIGGDVAFNTITNVASTAFNVNDGTLTHLAITPTLTTETNATITNVASTAFNVKDATLTHLAITPTLTTETNATITNVASTAFNVTDGTLTHLAITPSLTTISNTTIGLYGINNTVSAVNSNIISTTGTSSGSSNQIIANGTSTYPNANNLIQATGYSGYNTISAMNQSGNGYNVIQSWYLNQITTASSYGTNEMVSTGVSGSNYIHTSNTNGSNTILSAGTGGINTISSSANSINGATTFNDYSGVSSVVTVGNSQGINVVNATTHATYNASSVSLMSLSSSYLFNTAPISTVYVQSPQCITSSFGTWTQAGIAFPVNVIPMGYYINSDAGTISTSPVNLTIQVIQFGSTVLATSGSLAFYSGSADNYNGKFSSPTASTAGNAYGCQINLTTSVTTNNKKFIVVIFFAQW